MRHPVTGTPAVATEDSTPPKGCGEVRDAGTTFAVRIEIDGRPLVLKEFLHDMIGGAVHGLVSGLRDVESPRTIRIDVTRL
jgi:hypothetical protein